MNAQKVIKLIKAVNPYGMKLKLGMREENKPLLDKIYSIANQIEPCDKQRNGKDRMLWLWIDKGSYKEYVENFEDTFTYKPLSKIFTVEKGRVDYVKMKKQWHIENVSLDSKIDYYETLLHICLELKKLGYPIVKPVEVEKKMSGEQLVAITPYNNNFDWNYSKKSGIYNLIDEQRKLPKAVVSELIEKIQWFPVGDWKYIGNRMLIDKVKKENLKSVKV